MALTKIKLNTGMVSGSLPDANIPDDLTINSAGITQSSGTLTIKNAGSDSNGLKIFQDSGDASKIYNHYNGTLQLGVGSTTALTIDSSENSTFAGVVTASGSTGSNYIGSFTNASATGWGLFVKGGADNADYSLRVQDKNAGDLLSVKAGGRVGVLTNDPSHSMVIKTHSSGTVNVFKIEEKDSTDALVHASFANSHDEGSIGIYYGGTLKNYFRGNGASYITGGSLGISNTNPQALLHVGTGADTPFISATALVSNAGTTNLAIRNASSNIELLNYVDSSQGIIGTATNHPLIIRTNNANRMYLRTDGKIGIGDDSPTTAKLSISHDDSSDANALYLYNPNTGAGAKVNLNFGLERNASAVKFIPARLQAGKEQEWTGTPSTVDGYLALQLVENETLTERVRVNSRGGIVSNGITVHASSSAKYGGSGSSGSTHSLARFWHDVVNWGDGGVIVEIFNFYYGYAQQGYGKYFCSWGYPNNQVRVVTISSTGSVNAPTWDSSATHVSGNIYRRDLSVNVPQYNIARMRFTTAVEVTTKITQTGNNKVYFY